MLLYLYNFYCPNFCLSELGEVPINWDNRGSTVKIIFNIRKNMSKGSLNPTGLIEILINWLSIFNTIKVGTKF